MAFDQVSLFLYPPRWERQSVAHPQMMHISGEPVSVVSDKRADSNGPIVQLADMSRWFEAKGFERGWHESNYHSALVPTQFGPQAEIDVTACAEGGEHEEVTSLYCRFRIIRDTPVRLERWEMFMLELCGTFGLRIGVADGDFVGAEEFLDVVKDTNTWQCFADQFGWAAPEGGGLT
jgi:hypothetical protein